MDVPVNRRRWWGRSRLVAISAALGVLAGACATGDDVAEGDLGAGAEMGTPVHGGELVVALDAETASLLPSEAEFANAGRNVAYAIFDTLTARGADGQVRPNLAESVTPSDDLRSWAVTLRSGVRFHDGTELDAEALRAMYEEFTLAEGSPTAGLLSTVEEVRVDGPLSVTFLLREPDASFADVLSLAPGMVFSASAARGAGDEAGVRPVGTGPFEVERWERDDKLVVVRHDDYWREGLPYLDRITFRPIPDESLRAQGLVAGFLDAMHTSRGATVKEVQREGGDAVTVHTTVGEDSGIFYMNTLVPPLDDVRIRRAIAHAPDREAVARIMGDDDLVEPATQYFSQDSPWYSERVAASAPTFDLEGARRAVADYVADPDRSDGKAVGETPAVRFQCLSDRTLVELGRYAQEQASAVGIDMTFTPMDQAELVGNVSGSPDSEPPFLGDYDVSCYRIFLAGDPAATFAQHFGPPESTPSNHTNFAVAELTERIDQLRRTSDFDARYALVEEIGLIINEHVPLAFGSQTAAAIAVGADVRNVTGWTLPDGTEGSGILGAVTRWGEVWREG